MDCTWVVECVLLLLSARNTAEDPRPTLSPSYVFCMFSRVQHPHPTCHLFLAPCGPAAGDSEEDIVRIFSPFGKVTVTASNNQRHAFVSFLTPQQAAAAAATVAADPGTFGGRQVKVRFAEQRKPRQQHARQPTPAVHSVAACCVPGLSLQQDFVSVEEEQVLATGQMLQRVICQRVTVRAYTLMVGCVSLRGC